jgi:hypothetical protein
MSRSPVGGNFENKGRQQTAAIAGIISPTPNGSLSNLKESVHIVQPFNL